MGSIEVFAQSQYFLITLLALGILFFASMYATAGQDKLFTPLWFLFIGLVLDFGANGAAYSGATAYAGGKDIDGYVFLELLLSLSAMIFLALAAIRLMVNGILLNWIVVGLGVLGILAVSLFVYIIPDGNVVNQMRQIFPLAGFACLAAGFWSQSNREFKSGSMLSAMLSSAVVIMLVCKYCGLYC